MKRNPTHIALSLLAGTAALLCALGATTAFAQTEPGFYRSLTDGARAGRQRVRVTPHPGGRHPRGRAEQDEQAELAKKLQNPVADLISVPIQNNWDFGIGSANAMKYTANIQPVVPISISKDWNLIIRTILPVIYAESPVKGGRHAWVWATSRRASSSHPRRRWAAGFWGPDR